MRVTKRWGMCLILAVLLVASGCTNNGIDDGGGPNVLLEILNMTTPPIQGETETGTCENNNPDLPASGNPCLSALDCPEGEYCELPIGGTGCQSTQWSITLLNVPKTPLATTSPYNDIIITEFLLTYTWSNGFPSSTTSVPLGITIPADSSGTIQFTPISSDVLEALEEYIGTGGSASAIVDFFFSGYVVDSDSIGVRGGAALELQNCLRPTD